MASAVPSILLNRYGVEKVLGEGTFGTTLLVHDRLQSNHPFVAKLLKSAAAPSPAESSLKKEFELLRSLYHPSIVEVMGWGEASKQHPSFLLMEWIKGHPWEAKDGLKKQDSWNIVASVIRALSFLHAKGIVHGDLKPANILIEEKTGLPKLIDFGLSTTLKKGEARGFPSGTLATMAPEVISEGRFSPQSDLYALGMILLGFLRGSFPFHDRSDAIIRFHLFEEPDLNFLEKHPWRAPLEEILKRLLHKDPSKRPADVLEVLTLLNQKGGTSFSIHRGEKDASSHQALFQKIDTYLSEVGEVLKLPSVSTPRSFLEEEEKKIEKYLALSKDLDAKEKALLKDRLEEAQTRLLVQKGLYEKALKVQNASDRVQNVRALAHIFREEFSQAETLLKKIVKNSRGVDRARAQNYLGISFYNQGKLDEAGPFFEESLQEMRRIHEAPGIVSNAMNLAAIHQQRNNILEALKLYREAHETAEQMANSFLLAILLSNMANLHLKVGSLSEASDYLARSQKLADELELIFLQAYNLLLEADHAVWKEDTARADLFLRKAMERFEKLKSPTHLALAKVQYAENAFRIRSGQEILKRLEEAKPAVTKSNFPETRLRWELCRLRSDITQGQSMEKVTSALQKLEKEFGQEASHRFQILSTHALWALATNEIPLVESDLKTLDALLREEQEKVPVSYRSRIAEAPRHVLYWEIHHELARRRKAPADAALWKLLEINRRITASHEPDQMNSMILDAAIELTGAERGFLIMPEYGKWKRGTWKIRAARNFRHRDLPGGRDLLSQTVIGRLLSSKKPLLIHDAQEEKDLSQFKSVQALKLRSILAVPIMVWREMIGALYLDHCKTDRLFKKKDLDLLKAFSDQCGIALTNARLHEEAIQRERLLTESRKKLEETNQKLEEELSRKAQWSETIEEELKKLQTTGPFVTRSTKLRPVIAGCGALAKSSQALLMTGEIGTGKTHLAKILHQEKGVGPFVSKAALDFPRQRSASDPEDHIASFFEKARGGTLCIEELGDLPLPYQRETLQLLKLQETEQKEVQVFLLLTSRLTEAELTKKGLLLPELRATLSGRTIHLPPLRKRMEDLNPLAHHILKEQKKDRGVDREITRSAMAILHEHDWPGNIRELQLELERASMATTSLIAPSDLSPTLLHKSGYVPGMAKKATPSLHDQRAEFEKNHILKVLEQTGWNKARAARTLGLSRAMLYIKIKEYRIPLK